MASENVDEDAIKMILMKMGLGEYVETFLKNEIGVNEVNLMSEDDFAKVGMTSVGCRLRLKQACNNYLKETESSHPTVVKQFLELQKKKKKVRRRSPVSDKHTRRIYVGWKHLMKNGQYRLVPANKGGGQVSLDIERDADYPQLLNTVVESYFPMGYNTYQNLKRDEVNSHLASFSGSSLPLIDEGFTVGKYFQQVKTNPVRMYLHTHMIQTTELPEDTGTSSDHDPIPPVTQTIELPEDTSTSSDHHHPIPQVTQNIVESTPTSDDDFESLGTPTIQLNTRLMGLRQRARDLLRLRRVVTPTEESTQPIVRHEPIVVDANDDEDDDEDLQNAILDSIETLPDQTLKGILARWISGTRTTHADPNLIIVQRDLILSSTLRVVRRATFDPTRDFKVTFSGEDGDDLGGPKREFLRCLMSEVKDDVLQGPDTNKVFRHDITKLATSRYQFAGKLVAFSILHGGPGLPVLNEEVYRLITGREMSQLPDLDCVVDLEARTTLIKLRDADTEESFKEAVDESSDFCMDRGLNATWTYRQLDRKPELLNILLKNELLYRVHSEIAQFTSGMDEVGHFHQTLISSPNVLQPLFVSSDTDSLTFSSMRQLYRYEFSPDGSNNRRNENNVAYCFEAFLADCEDGSTGVSLGDVLSFWTGAQSVPPLGFSSIMVVDFVSGDNKQLPSASTCGMVLHIWRGYADADEFARDFTMGIQLGGGFYLA